MRPAPVHMYGTRDAAQDGFEEYSSTLERAGCTRGVANPCLFMNKAAGVGLMVHGDDFLAAGPSAGVLALESTLEKAYKVKSQIMGGNMHEDRGPAF